MVLWVIWNKWVLISVGSSPFSWTNNSRNQYRFQMIEGLGQSFGWGPSRRGFLKLDYCFLNGILLHISSVFKMRFTKDGFMSNLRQMSFNICWNLTFFTNLQFDKSIPFPNDRGPRSKFQKRPFKKLIISHESFNVYLCSSGTIIQ